MKEVNSVNGDEERKLRVLLDYWVRHNEEHGQEFREWAEKARDFGEVAVHNELVAAAEGMDKANASLARALKELEREK